MDVSVAICTRDRAESLRRTLASIQRAAIPAGLGWELLVVDNGSRDDTASVIEGFAAALPVRRVAAPEPGLSRARNAGVAAAQAERLVWTDDDVEVEPGWLAALLGAFDRHPDAAFFGGRILPELEPPVPAWLAAHAELFSSAFAGRDFGDTPQQFAVAEGQIPFGANMAFRTPVLRRFPFDEAVGAGTRVGTGEESKVIRQMSASGEHGFYVPESAVRHHIPASRMTLAYIDRFKFQTAYALEREQPSAGPRLFGLPRWVLRDLVTQYVRYGLRRALRPETEWAPNMARLAFARGRVRYWLDRRRER